MLERKFAGTIARRICQESGGFHEGGWSHVAAAPSRSRPRPIRKRRNSAIVPIARPNRHRLSRFRSGAGREPQSHRTTGDLHQDHSREWQDAGAGVLRQMRLAYLFDDGRRRRAADLYAACRHFTPAQRVHATAANLVALGAAVGYPAPQHAACRKADVMPLHPCLVI